VGEKVIPFPDDDPCSTYVCGVGGEMRVEIETCENTPEVCPDGKSPFKVPGECCLGCSEFYLYPQSLHYFKAHFFFFRVSQHCKIWTRIRYTAAVIQ
jgi:hypothetical protein